MASLLELEKQLSAKDSVMEPHVAGVLRAYVADGGNPKTAVDLLADNFRGYAPMASLVCDWLSATDTATTDRAVPLNTAVPGPPGPEGSTYEYRFLEAVVRARFDGKRVDEETKRLQATPKWFTDLMNSAQGRQLLYALAEQHRGCITVGLAIGHAWTLGHTDEVARLGAAAASKFDIFHSILRKRLDSVLHAPNESSRNEAIGELQRLCLGSPVTYLFVQMMLSRLACEPGGAPLRRVSHELEQTAAAQHGVQLMRSMAPLLASNDADGAAISAVYAFLAAFERTGSHARANVELASLWALYAPRSIQDTGVGAAPMDTDDAAAQMPTLEPLRLPGVITALLRAAFQPGVPVPRSVEGGLPPAYELLALGCATAEERAATRSALVTSATACERAASGLAPQQDVADALKKAPVAAAGAVVWARHELGDPEYYRRVEAQPSHPAYMALLKCIAEVAPSQHGALVDVLSAAMRAMGRSVGPERTDATLRLVPTLLRCGCVIPLLASVKTWAEEADRSTVRRFINAVLEVAAPPYSRAFAVEMLALCVSSGMPNAGGLATAFVSEVSRAHKAGAFNPPLNAAEQRLLGSMSM
jgi:negative elongation factor C/D